MLHHWRHFVSYQNNIIPLLNKRLRFNQIRLLTSLKSCLQLSKLDEMNSVKSKDESFAITTANDQITGEICPTTRVVPMLVNKKETTVLPFDEVPGPKTLKYISTLRQYLSEVGTQITGGILTLGLNFGKNTYSNFVFI